MASTSDKNGDSSFDEEEDQYDDLVEDGIEDIASNSDTDQRAGNERKIDFDESSVSEDDHDDGESATKRGRLEGKESHFFAKSGRIWCQHPPAPRKKSSAFFQEKEFGNRA